MIHTRADAEILLGYIDTLVDSLYGLESKSFENVAERLPSEKIAQKLIAEIKTTSKDSRKDHLRELKLLVKNCEIMKLSVAIDLDQEMIQEIVARLREKWERLILDLEVQPEIIGGAKITWRGKYWERTLLSKYEQI
ncbi:MAG: hypothetical protein G01um101416_608 [Microgenomates group bacterium Gr01-1014_16]|nr:MAG: hypothetical protein G01um101416_608 [Microgenomates group bacterium Gr01-1014_16]